MIENKILNLQATRIFYENFYSNKEINLNIGGGGSSKTYSLMQLFMIKLLTEKKKKMLIVRRTLPALKRTIWMPFREMLKDNDVLSITREDRTLLNIFYDDNLISFGGLDDVEKWKSANWNYIWIEEATEVTKKDFDTLRLYLRERSVDKKKNQIFLSFNPIDENHWIKKWIIDSSDYDGLVKVIHSTYRDNPFLDESSRIRYEKLAEQDTNMYRIYCLGEWGRLEHVIFNNWDVVSSIPEDGIVVYGVDPGFNDPTAVVKCVIKEKEVWVEEKLYHKGYTNSQLIDWFKTHNSDGRVTIYYDSQYPDRISEFQKNNLNAIAANKKLKDGIDTLKSYQIHVLENSPNLMKELRSYCWKTDRNNNVLDEPVDFENHLIDALRYAVHTYNKKTGTVRVVWI